MEMEYPFFMTCTYVIDGVIKKDSKIMLRDWMIYG